MNIREIRRDLADALAFAKLANSNAFPAYACLATNLAYKIALIDEELESESEKFGYMFDDGFVWFKDMNLEQLQIVKKHLQGSIGSPTFRGDDFDLRLAVYSRIKELRSIE